MSHTFSVHLVSRWGAALVEKNEAHFHVDVRAGSDVDALRVGHDFAKLVEQGRVRLDAADFFNIGLIFTNLTTP